MDDLGGKPTIFGNIHIRKAHNAYLFPCFQAYGLRSDLWSLGVWQPRILDQLSWYRK